ncbi:MAG TPA: NnrS family protein, partial [Candidatus Eisenbacteria bacterium]|nr:NnrS family protein [Candidatus Eisenbacteria bacterium]
MGIPLPVREPPRVVPGQEPYRRLFPLGVVVGLTGVGLWIAHAAGWIAYPGTAHAMLLLLGFQQCFILGFLMTAMPAFLHAPHCRKGELGAAVVAVAAASACALAGWNAAA